MIPLPTLDALDAVSIPVACPVPWDSMHGDHRTRFCDQCQQNVHDVSELTRAEALALLSEGGAKPPCLRLYKRQDGRVMTSDCATKRDRVWKWLHKRSKFAAALFALVFFAGCDPNKPKECIAGGIEVPPAPPEVKPTEAANQIGYSVATGVRHAYEYPER